MMVVRIQQERTSHTTNQSLGKSVKNVKVGHATGCACRSSSHDGFSLFQCPLKEDGLSVRICKDAYMRMDGARMCMQTADPDGLVKFWIEIYM
mmetsp:Transcript_8609/g.11055  ORF Transcript_8609/g.11055 Transcript_8609/m.11055 type:complete len:93 (-) Transcript_8609:21-299(-)